MSSYLYPIQPSSAIDRNCRFYRISGDIVRLICEYLDSMADIVAFCKTCKFVYLAISPLFSCRFSGTDWSTLCMRGTGLSISPVTITHVRGTQLVYVFCNEIFAPDEEDVLNWEHFHLNSVIKSFNFPKIATDGTEYILVDRHNKKRVYTRSGLKVYASIGIATNGNAKYFAKDARNLLGKINQYSFKRIKRSIEEDA